MELFVATDFSEHSRAAVKWGAHLAEQLGCSLTVGHVVDLAGDDHLWSSLLKGPEELRETSEENARQQLEEFYAEHVDGGPQEVEYFTAHGRPQEVLGDVVKQREDVVLVIGSRGRTDNHDIPFGNTARRLVRSSPGPVILVPPEAALEPLDQIVVGADASAPSREAIRRAAWIAKAADSKVTAVYGYETPDTLAMARVMAAQGMEVEELVDQKRAEILEIIDNADAAEVVTDIETIENPAEQAIVEAASDLEAALIVVGTHGREGVKRFLLGNTAERVIRRSQCPVLVTPADEDDVEEQQE